MEYSNIKKKVLFICTHNSARSQMAEGLMKKSFGDSYDIFSAGTEPSRINPFAIKAMDEIGIDISQQRAKGIQEFIDKKFDYVITVCDQARESCPFFPGGRIIHKGFKDPARAEGSEEQILDAFRKSRDEIKVLIDQTFKDEAQ